MTTGDLLGRILIGESCAIRELRRRIVAVASVREPVLVQGETGTGKELVVEAVHALSGRNGKLTTVNTPAIAEATFEATLFGHTRGAFTGAVAELPGLLGEAQGGTLFLDEIGSFPMALQPKLLRVTETMRYRPVGASGERQGDFRLLSAANEDLEARVVAGSFRADLLERIGAIRIDVPPLRQRIEDIPLLASHFARQAVGDGYPAVRFTTPAITALMEYDWPRNVRQLRNLVRRAALLGPTALEPHDVRTLLAEIVLPHSAPADSAERVHLIGLLDAAEWNVDEVARRLGVGRSTLYRTLKEYGIRRPKTVGRRLASVPAQL